MEGYPPALALFSFLLPAMALFAFHDSLLPQHQTVAELYGLLGAGAVVGALGSRLVLRAMSRFACPTA